MRRQHRMPFGAEYCPEQGVRFRLWAPKAREVKLSLWSDAGEISYPMRPNQGWFETLVEHAQPASRYKFHIDAGLKVPDPASRFQPLDVHGPSAVVDPAAFEWTDENWRGRPWQEAVIYELHLGTFTPEGTFAAAQKRLEYLAGIGVTAVELMPLADFPGKRNWGYDGVLQFAPDSQYGEPDDLKSLIQSAHRLGLMMFLDVVYNHFGPEGNYLHSYAPDFFTRRHRTPWGDAINFDGPGSRTVRDFFIHNALYWLNEYHFDGLRFDAVHAIVDDSQPDFLTELAETLRRDVRPSGRYIHLVLENDNNAAHYLKADEDARPKLYTAQWNDDIHHALHVTLTGENDGYYGDHGNAPVRRLGRCLTQGFDYQGEISHYRDHQPRGEPSRNLPLTAFVSFLQNHDQVGNRAFGDRLGAIVTSRKLRVVTSILLLAPAPPLLFMGEEFNATTPFLFFCDFGPDLAAQVTEGRRNEFARFARFDDPAARSQIPDPGALETFDRSKLDWRSIEQPEQREWLNFYRTLLDLRHRELAPRIQGVTGEAAHFEVLGERALRVEWRLSGGEVLHLLANLGDDPVSSVSKPPGANLYATHEFGLQATGLPEWSAAWFLER